MSEKPVAIVTGGGKGIGAACCRALSGEGFLVGIHYRSSEEHARALLSEIGDGFLLPADLVDIDQVELLVNKIKEKAGRVDVLVNNAGSISQRRYRQHEDRAIRCPAGLDARNMVPDQRIIRLFMLRQRGGRIIDISSVVGHTGNAGQIPYTMEKAALDAFTKSLSQELAGRNILVNSVCRNSSRQR